MRKFKVTNQIKKELKQIANGLPILYDRSVTYKMFSGRELKLTGHTIDDAGNKLEDDKIYPLPIPVMNARNHYRRLKKLYENGGEPQVIDYIAKTKKEVVELESQE